MKRKILRLLAWISGLFIMAVAVFALVLYINSDRVIERVVNETNQLLEVPVDVKQVNVSLRKFPLASVRFRDVYTPGREAGPADTLLYAQELFFEFHLWQVITGNFRVSRISMENGQLYLRLADEENLPNYQIWKSDTASASSTLFTLDEVNLKNIRLRLLDPPSQTDLLARIDRLQLSGQFEPTAYRLETESRFFLDSLRVAEQLYLAQSQSEARLELKGDTGKFEIRNGLLHLEGLPLDFRLDYGPHGVHLNAQQQQLPLDKLLAFCAQQGWYQMPPKVEARGKAGMVVQAYFPAEEELSIQVNFNLKDGNLREKARAEIQNINLAGSYQRNGDNDRVVIKRFTGKSQTGNLAGSLDITNLNSPRISLDLKSDLALSEWLLFLPLDTIDGASGRARIDLHLENHFRSLEDITAAEWKRTRASGHLTLENIGFTFKNTGKTLRDLSGQLSFNDNDLRVENFFFRTGRSDVYLSGTFGNVFNYLFMDHERLHVDARVRSQELQMEDFLLASAGAEDSPSDYDLEFVKSLFLDLQLEVDRFYFSRFNARDIRGLLAVKNGQITGRQISLHANGGRYAGTFSIDTRPTQYYTLRANLLGEDIDLNHLFTSFNNFGQEALVAENIYGTADMDVQLSCPLQPNLSIDPARVKLTADLDIANGNIRNYEPMLALSDYARLDELRDVRFERLTNRINIENSVIYIPEMYIRSNVLDMGLSGQHRFDHQIDYSLKLKLSEVVFKQRKKQNRQSEFDEHLNEVARQDEPYIYVRMDGSVDNPHIYMDKESLRKSIKEDLRDQGRELRNIFSRKKKEKPQNSGLEFDLFGSDKDDQRKR